MKKFHEISDLKINSTKSMLFSASILGRELDDILHMTGILKGSFPVQYLSIYLAISGLKSFHLPPKDKILGFINSFIANSFSYASKLELTKAIIYSYSRVWNPFGFKLSPYLAS